MAQVEGLNLRGSRWYVRIVISDDLQEVFGKARVNIALGTSDRRDATLLATIKRAEWLADFEAKRAERNPSQIATITPDLAAHLAALVRVHVLSEDDRVRADVGLIAEMVHIRSELERRKREPLRIPQWEPTEKREDDLSGLTPEEAAELADLNAYLEGNAVMALAGGNLKAVLPLVQAQAAKLGLHFDTKTPGAREALQACLKAYRAAHRATAALGGREGAPWGPQWILRGDEDGHRPAQGCDNAEGSTWPQPHMQQDHVNEDVAFVVRERFARTELGADLVLLAEHLQRELQNLAG